eukprot:6208688-Pleurochrysis_carterae.AAC.3
MGRPNELESVGLTADRDDVDLHAADLDSHADSHALLAGTSGASSNREKADDGARCAGPSSSLRPRRHTAHKHAIELCGNIVNREHLLSGQNLSLTYPAFLTGGGPNPACCPFFELAGSKYGDATARQRL